MNRPLITLEAPAKVNLYLGVHPQKDVRGYHRVDSVMCAVDLCDVVEVSLAEKGAGTSVACSPDAGCPLESNTCYKAVMALAKATGNAPDVAVSVEKHIPSCSGTGGASTDAAAVILGLARLWGLAPGDVPLMNVARTVGADVPFFLQSGVAWLAGAGDVLERAYPKAMPMLVALPVVLVRAPGGGVSTPAAYAGFDRDPVPAAPLAPMLDALAAADADGVVGALANNLEPAACSLHPSTGEVRSWLASQDGVRASQVTGSGSTSFAVCDDEAAAERIEREAHGRGWWARVASFVGHGACEMGLPGRP